jgi:hypothetical protein
MIRVSRLTCAIGALLLASGVGAQDYPTKPITFVVPFAAGSATDQLARALGQSVSEQGKQAVVVDNKPGASGFLAAQFVAKASPDGHTVLITTNTTHAANEHLYKSMPYDPVKDFAPVTLLGKGGQIMIVNPKVQAKTVGRVPRAREEESRQALIRQRQLVQPASPVSLLQQMAGDRAAAHSLQEQSARDHRSPRRADRHDDHGHGHRVAAGERRKGEGARRHRAHAHAARARHSDHRRGGREGLRDGLLVRGLRAGEDAARDRGAFAEDAGRGDEERRQPRRSTRTRAPRS